MAVTWCPAGSRKRTMRRTGTVHRSSSLQETQTIKIRVCIGFVADDESFKFGFSLNFVMKQTNQHLSPRSKTKFQQLNLISCNYISFYGSGTKPAPCSIFYLCPNLGLIDILCFELNFPFRTKSLKNILTCTMRMCWGSFYSSHHAWGHCSGPTINWTKIQCWCCIFSGKSSCSRHNRFPFILHISKRIIRLASRTVFVPTLRWCVNPWAERNAGH